MLSVPRLSAVNYHEWRIACTMAAKKCLPTNGCLGGLGLLLPTAEFTTLNNNVPYERAVPPRNVTSTAHAHLQAVYDREQIALGALTSTIFESVPVATQQACPGYHAQYGTSFIPLPDMMSHIHAKFGDASVNAYNQAKAILQHPYAHDVDIDVFLAAQVEAHLACVRANNPLNDIEKVDALIKAIGGRSGPFAFTINKFEEECSHIAFRKFEDTLATAATLEIPAVPATDAVGDEGDDEYTPAVPATTYVPGCPAQEGRAGLASRIRMAAPRILDTPPAPTTKGYFGAAEVVASFKDSIKEALADALNTANATGPRTDRSPTRRDLYCWSHGLGGHSSTQCKNPRAGHNPRASATKRLGGSTKGCPK